MKSNTIRPLVQESLEPFHIKTIWGRTLVYKFTVRQKYLISYIGCWETKKEECSSQFALFQSNN